MRALELLRIVDSHDGRPSLSTLAFGATLVLLLVSQTWVALAAFVASSALYAHRRILVHRGAARQADVVLMRREMGSVLESAASIGKELERIEQRLAAVENRPRVR